MKSQILILKIKWDESKNIEPRSWDWVSILDCKDECVEILNYGSIENENEKE